MTLRLYRSRQKDSAVKNLAALHFDWVGVRYRSPGKLKMEILVKEVSYIYNSI